MKNLRLLTLICSLFGILSCSQAQKKSSGTDDKPRQVQKTAEEWKKILTAQEYDVLREEGTERPFSSPLNANKKKGVYSCAGCHTPLFSSEHKFESGTGWPSFYKPLYPKNVDEKSDRSLGMVRTEVLCNVCGGHLGHIFEDGPPPTGLRYCLNGVALDFKPKE
jgi:peptide-methionine (R)-S-oxide reductase